MKRTAIGLIIIAILIIIISVISGNNRIVGKWADVSSASGGTYYFNKDGTFQMTVSGGYGYNGTYSVKGKTITFFFDTFMGKFSQEYSYALKGKSLTLKGTELFGSGAVVIELKKQK